MVSNKQTVTAKMKAIDWANLKIVQEWYREERGLELKDSSAIKMLIADKATEIKEKQLKDRRMNNGN